VDRVGRNTTFNGEQIFSQSRTSLGGDPTKRAVMDGLKLGWLEEAESLVSQYYGITGDGADISIELTTFTDGAGGVAAQVSGTGGAGGKLNNLKLQVDMADFTPPNLPNGGSSPFYNDRIIAHEMVHAIMGRSMNFTALPTWFKEGAAEYIHGADERLAGDIAAAGGGNAGITSVLNTLSSWALDSAHYSSAYVATRYLDDKLKTSGQDGIKAMMTYLNQNPAADLDAAMTHFFGGGYTAASFVTEVQANGVNFVNNQMNLTNSDTGAVGGLDASGGAIRSATTVLTDYGTTYGDNVLTGFHETFETVSNAATGSTELQFQVGAEAGQTINAGVGAMNSQALGINDIDLTTNARVAIVHIDQALDAINKERGKIGAELSRFEKTISNLQTGSENLSASRSRIQDTDFAAETASLVRAQIMQKSIASVVAQANATPALALQLLRH
jgi:flagellin